MEFERFLVVTNWNGNSPLPLFGLLGFVFVSQLWATDLPAAEERPNVVWIVSEDNSIHYLKHFFKDGVVAPNIEAMAAHGLTYRHAFSNAPVCSVARTTLATGCFGPRIGTQFHRRYRLAAMPRGLKMFPAYLREAGYYTTNNRKKDYNAVEGDGVWDESSGKASWRNRPDKRQPFFHMESHSHSHEGTLHFPPRAVDQTKTDADPTKVVLADYHPDTPLFRYTHARYLDRMTVIDKIVGQTIAKLKEDGELENTFVFYFGDHGGVLPRSKGYLYESGLHVPLIVRVPERYRDVVDSAIGSDVNGFVSFVDFGPTVLRLAGVRIPPQMDGRPFLGKGISSEDVERRDEAFGYADRFDEKYDLVRSLRKGKFQYLRNYQAYLPDGLNNNYRYKAAAYDEWRRLFQARELKGPAKRFFEPRKVEALYDCEADPHQVHNLANDPKYASVLHDLRRRLQTELRGWPDLSFFPESHLVANAMEDAVGFGQRHQQAIAQMMEVADLALLPFDKAEPHLRAALQSERSGIRFWGATACACFGKEAKSMTEEVRPLLKDDEPTVQIRAAEFLGRVGAVNPQPTLIGIVNSTDDPVVATEALNAVVWFRDFFGDRYPVKRSDFNPQCRGAGMESRLNYINGIPYPSRRPPKGKRKGNAASKARKKS